MTIPRLLSPICRRFNSTLSKTRNIGISAHIDSGKTTFTERVLFYTGRIDSIHEVRGKDAIGAKMDSMELEREKGITIQSAATYCKWKDYHINIIDTPGHIDFTIEVERALRVLDGAILVLCASSGVQSQTLTVDRQMRRYNVPRISFINKMDRLGANPWRVIEQINKKLKIPAASIHVPIGFEDTFCGVVDLIKMKALYNEGERGLTVAIKPIPEELLDFCKEKRQILIETLADCDDAIAELFLEEIEPTEQQLLDSIRRATISLKFSPVLMGSALADTGVQNALDAVCDFLPDPSQVVNTALDLANKETPVTLQSKPDLPFVGLAFKLEEGRYGQLTYFRIYQGSLKKGTNMFNMRTSKKVRVSRLVRMHSNEMEDISEIGPGEICAIFGIECSSGDTFTTGQIQYSLTSMFIPAPVISYAIKPSSSDANAQFSKALGKFQREDPTFRVHIDSESKETIISGMGELHLDVYIERLKREYQINTVTGQPQVAYRETITQKQKFSYVHKKQSGGAGQYAKVEGYIEPMEEITEPDGSKTNLSFVSEITGARIPEEYIPGVERGFREGCQEGFLIGHPIQGVRFVLQDGQTHSVDSSELAFRMAAYHALRNAFLTAGPQALEPVMRAVVTCPSEFQGTVLGSLTKRRAMVVDSEMGIDDAVITTDVPLANMFSYASDLRAQTQGKGEFTMEFKDYQPVMPDQEAKLIEDYKKKTQKK